MRELERAVGTFRHLIEPALDPDSRVSALLVHFETYRSVEAFAPAGLFRAPAVNSSPRDPALAEVLQSAPFAASAARIVAAQQSSFNVDVVIATLAEIRSGELGFTLFLKTLHSKYSPNLPVCRVVKSVNGEVYSAFLAPRSRRTTRASRPQL